MRTLNQSQRTRIDQIIEAVNPGPDREDLELLLINIELYIQQTVTSKRKENIVQVSSHPLFDFRTQQASMVTANELNWRLDILSDYQLSTIKQIQNWLLAGIHASRGYRPSSRQIALLQALNQDPNIGIVRLAKKLATTHRTIRTEKNR